MAKSRFMFDVGVIGGAGHVGCPLALTFASTGLKTLIYDISAPKVDMIRSGVMPFIEEGADELLKKVLADGTLTANATPEHIASCKYLVLIIGTPVDEHLNPTFTEIFRAIADVQRHLRDGQTLILRSTVFPGISRYVQRYLRGQGLKIKVAFCPERVAQGYSIREFHELPQIISAFDKSTLKDVRALFARFAKEIVEMEPMEAELCKLMTNSWRYIQFAIVNQFYMIATQNSLNFDRILHGCRHKYPRMSGMPGPGFAAGPCLVKDTMQLAAFSNNQFVLGHAAMLINEGLPAHLIALAKRECDLAGKTVGILGMAFKAESDDPRDSLSYKLRKLLLLEADHVICSDPYVKDDRFLPMEDVIKRSDVVFVGTPHKAYRGMKLPRNKIVIDVWSCLAPTSPKKRGAK